MGMGRKWEHSAGSDKMASRLSVLHMANRRLAASPKMSQPPLRMPHEAERHAESPRQDAVSARAAAVQPSVLDIAIILTATTTMKFQLNPFAVSMK